MSFIHSFIGREAAVARSALTCDGAAGWPLSHGVGVAYNIGIEDTFEWEKQHIVVVVVVVLLL